jgi:hypothetical protein
MIQISSHLVIERFHDRKPAVGRFGNQEDAEGRLRCIDSKLRNAAPDLTRLSDFIESLMRGPPYVRAVTESTRSRTAGGSVGQWEHDSIVSAARSALKADVSVIQNVLAHRDRRRSSRPSRKARGCDRTTRIEDKWGNLGLATA